MGVEKSSGTAKLELSRSGDSQLNPYLPPYATVGTKESYADFCIYFNLHFPQNGASLTNKTTSNPRKRGGGREGR